MVRRRTARRIGATRNSLRKCIRPLVENGLRAHDDDPRVPVLDNRRGREKPCYVTGFQARRWTVFFVFYSSADFREANFKKPLCLVGKDSRFVHGMIIVLARQHCPTDPGQLVGSSDDHHVACSSGFQSAHPLSERRLLRV
jgi:hypothetical protein